MNKTEEINQNGKDVWILSPDCREYITIREVKLRRIVEFVYRFLFSVFLSAHLFDFLFNPIWMHGYLWSLNQPIEMDLSDKAAGVILEHQLKAVGYIERLMHAFLSTLAVIIMLRLSGYHITNHNVWHLLKLSMACGAASGLARTLQMKCRLYAVFHESFYIYLHFFVIGFCMTWRVFERNSLLKEQTTSSILTSLQDFFVTSKRSVIRIKIP